MSRVQLALNVSDLDAAIAFYTKLFDSPPAKRRPGYANFALVEPPLKLILIEGAGEGGTLNHLGVEVASTEEVGAAQRRLAGQGLATAVEDEVACCYAVQDKVWVDGPDREPWEIYTVLADVEMPPGQLRTVAPDGGAGCCATRPSPSRTSRPVPAAADSARCRLTSSATGCSPPFVSSVSLGTNYNHGSSPEGCQPAIRGSPTRGPAVTRP